MTLYSPSLGLKPRYAVIVEYRSPNELGKSIYSNLVISLPFALLIVTVSH